jgi:hypothetical protein
MYDYLRGQNYSREISKELCGKYAENLQKAYEQGWDMGESYGKRKNDPTSATAATKRPD